MKNATIREGQRLAKYVTQKTGKPCFYCVLCQNWYEGYGNNPYPLATGKDDECCDMCNATKVIPARLARL